MSPKIKDKKIISVLLKRRGQSEQLSAIGFVPVTEKNQRRTANRRDEPAFQNLIVRGAEGKREVIPQQEATRIDGFFESFGRNNPVGCKSGKAEK
jgi:hypothetical protein